MKLISILKRYVFVLLLASSVHHAEAQIAATITGRVTDSTGTPIPPSQRIHRLLHDGDDHQ